MKRERRRRAEEIQAELEDHIERRARVLMRKGYSPDAARAEARRRLGDAERIEEDCMRTWQRHWWRNAVRQWLDDAVRDVALAVRGFRRRPTLTAGVVLTLALAIGAATSVFTVVNAVLVRPLPYPNSGRLHSVGTRYLPETGNDWPFFTVSGPELADYAAMTRAMAGIAGYRSSTVNLAPDEGVPERLTAVEATANLFDVLDVQAALGRGFAPADGLRDAECVTVLADGLWRDRFRSDASVVDRDVRLNGRPCRVVGVMPAGFGGVLLMVSLAASAIPALRAVHVDPSTALRTE